MNLNKLEKDDAKKILNNPTLKHFHQLLKDFFRNKITKILKKE